VTPGACPALLKNKGALGFPFGGGRSGKPGAPFRPQHRSGAFDPKKPVPRDFPPGRSPLRVRGARGRVQGGERGSGVNFSERFRYPILFSFPSFPFSAGLVAPRRPAAGATQIQTLAPLLGGKGGGAREKGRCGISPEDPPHFPSILSNLFCVIFWAGAGCFSCLRGFGWPTAVKLNPTIKPTFPYLRITFSPSITPVPSPLQFLAVTWVMVGRLAVCPRGGVFLASVAGAVLCLLGFFPPRLVGVSASFSFFSFAFMLFGFLCFAPAFVASFLFFSAGRGLLGVGFWGGCGSVAAVWRSVFALFSVSYFGSLTWFFSGFLFGGGRAFFIWFLSFLPSWGPPGRPEGGFWPGAPSCHRPGPSAGCKASGGGCPHGGAGGSWFARAHPSGRKFLPGGQSVGLSRGARRATYNPGEAMENGVPPPPRPPPMHLRLTLSRGAVAGTLREPFLFSSVRASGDTAAGSMIPQLGFVCTTGTSSSTLGGARPPLDGRRSGLGPPEGFGPGLGCKPSCQPQRPLISCGDANG